MTALIMTADKIGLPSVAGWFKRLNATLVRRAQIKNTIKELNMLTDHELHDIGIHRSQIFSIANEVHNND